MRSMDEILEAADKMAKSLEGDLKQMELQILKDDFGKRTELWKSAFKEYNEFQTTNGGHPLSMNCRGCWYKVLKFHEDEDKLNK